MNSLLTLPGEPTSYWLASTKTTNYPLLTKDLEAEVVIIGGGIVGLTTGYLLQKAGKKTILLEGRKIIHGVSSKTSAKITSLHTLIYDYLIHQFGLALAQDYANAQELAIEFISQAVEKNQIDCDFVRAPAYTFTEKAENLEKIKKEVEAAKKLKLPASFVEKSELPFEIKGAVKFENQAHFHPRKYLLALAQLFVNLGGQIYEDTSVTNLSANNSPMVETSKVKITTKTIVLATHYPLLTVGSFYTKLIPKRSYVLGVYTEEQIDGMYINIEEPLFSVRPQLNNKGKMLVVTGLEHKTGVEPNTIDCYQELEKMARKKFKVKTIAYHWSTQDNSTIDNVPYIGKVYSHNPNLYVATGFDGWGMTNGTVSALLLSDMILGKNNPWQMIFDPGRKEFSKAGKFISQNLYVGKTYVEDWIHEPKEIDPKTLSKGEAKIIKYQGQKIAAFCDFEGKLHLVSAICTHLGCTITFNKAEQSWDCPCHGSRYSVDGEIIHSPTVRPLPTLSKSAD
ncbi:MAG: FAD-dependent oxidoreductase [Patescibacteria group bacterium]|nr:FAD-dependent oxidoreductase [Patescibacteria group bacterium]